MAGTPIELVSKLLGHRSVQITEKHYNKWIPERQRQLDATVRNSWKSIETVTSTSHKKKTRKKPA